MVSTSRWIATFVAAVVGWVTNWVAVKLTFLPVEFIGWRPFLGWQGIIPSKAEKMATIFVDSTMTRLGTLQDVFYGMEPRKVADHVVRYLEPRMDETTDEVMAESNPVLWENLPALVKSQVYAGARRGLPRIVHGLMEEITERVEELIDFKHMIVSRLVENRALLNRLFLESGRADAAISEVRNLPNAPAAAGWIADATPADKATLYKSWNSRWPTTWTEPPTFAPISTPRVGRC